MRYRVDDHSRLAYAEVLPDEQGATAAGFWRRAQAWFAAAGITVQNLCVLLAGNTRTVAGRNASTRSDELAYRATTAQWHAERRASRPKVAKLVANQQLCQYVQDRLAGNIERPNGEPVVGPDVRFTGRRHGRRADRRWAKSWSPEQISNRLRLDFPDDETMRISHEA